MMHKPLKVFFMVTDPFHSIEMTSPFVNLLEATAAPVSRSRMMIVSPTPALPWCEAHQKMGT